MKYPHVKPAHNINDRILCHMHALQQYKQNMEFLSF